MDIPRPRHEPMPAAAASATAAVPRCVSIRAEPAARDYAADSRGGGLKVEIAADPSHISTAKFARLRDGLPRFLDRATEPGALDLPLQAMLSD